MPDGSFIPGDVHEYQTEVEHRPGVRQQDDQFGSNGEEECQGGWNNFREKTWMDSVI